MTVGIFTSHDTGFAELLGNDDWTVDDYYAVLADTTETVDRSTQINYEDILQECADVDYDQIALTGKTVAVDGSGNITFDCDKINFGASVTISARFLYILKGTAATPVTTDNIVGSIDLQTETGNVSSTAAEFSFDPDATDGLFEVARSAAV